MKRIIILTTTAALFGSCSVYKSYKTPEVQAEQIAGQAFELPDSASAIPYSDTFFTDSNLQELIHKAIQRNADLQIANLSIEQAEAMLMTSKLAYLPSFMLSPEGSVSSFDRSKAAWSYNLPVNAQWEIDLSGRLRNNKEQARSRLLQSQTYKKLVQTQLVAAVANSYYTLIMLDQQLKITEECIANQKSNLDAIIAMKEAGMQTEAAVNQATASYFNVQTSGKDLAKQIRMVENSIALLINETPAPIKRSSYLPEPLSGTALEEGISLNALANRPDVKNAEFMLRENFYGVNAAHSAFYPSITLGGLAGWTNNAGGMIANPGKLLLSAVGSIAQPLFNKGVNIANLKIAKARYEQSLLAFHQTLLNAGVEVNDALISCQNSKEKISLRQKQVEANLKALNNSSELMKYSSATYLEVLYAENTYLQSRLMQVADWFEGVQGEINLYKALGGGIE